MKVSFKIQPVELNEKLFQNIKRMFEGRVVTITISTEMDETDYLNANPANKKHLLENIARKTTVRFTPEKFDKHVNKLLKNSNS
jgi:hypothetical protein